MSALSDRNLLFGILALQLDFISRENLIEAMHAWVLNKDRTLGQILVEQNALCSERHLLLVALVQEHVRQHDDDAEKSLAAASSIPSVREDLKQILDRDLQASLAHVAKASSSDADIWATVTPSVGTPTSTGLRFRILRPHAKGGLGQVSVAQDEELHREVALKEIQDRHADDPYSRLRFVQEAEITGGLEHPGIVPVYGLGQYADGRPFYAMRFIRGDSLREAIERFHSVGQANRKSGERTLEMRQLLGRFLDVCNAVAYAHSRGVLHRDLKPGNIMLGRYGETLVVDWGLAKPLDPTKGNGSGEGPLKLTSASGSALTQMGSAIGTPNYMSPEQAAGRLDLLGPASDVYSLGATLYSLLTGKAAFEGQDVGAILQKVQRGEFQPPRQVKREVPAALESVCLKSMALRPEDRYSTPRALAGDIEAWLADEPVSAFCEPIHARTGRWARRHQVLVAATGAGMLMAILAGGTGAWWLERQRLERRQSVEASLNEVVRLQGQALWLEAKAELDQAKRRLGDKGAYDLKPKLARAQSELDLVERLDAIRLKRTSMIEGQWAKTDLAYEKIFRDAGLGEVDSDEGVAAQWIVDSAVRGTLVAAFDDWAAIAERKKRRAWLLKVAKLADPDSWRDRVRDPAVWDDKVALTQVMREAQVAQQSPQFLVALAVRLMDLGGDAVEVLRQTQERYPGDFWTNFDLARALYHLKKVEEAIGFYRAALAVRPGTAVIYNNIGCVLRDQNKLDEAISSLRKAISFDSKLAMAHYNLGNVLNDQDQHEEALAAFRKTIESDPQFAEAYCNLGRILSDKGEFVAALAARRMGHELGSKRKDWVYPSDKWVKECEVLVELESRLSVVLKGEAKPANVSELIAFANMCYTKRRYDAAADLFSQAFAIDPKLAEDLETPHRYNAACSAALAAAGQGKDADQLDSTHRDHLRRQALEWLGADLAVYVKQAEGDSSTQHEAISAQLRHWQRDTDLSSVRGESVNQLPEDEGKAWNNLWAAVGELLKKVHSK